MKKTDNDKNKILRSRGIICILFYSLFISIGFFLVYIIKLDFEKIFWAGFLLNSVFLIWAVLPLKRHYITANMVLNFLILLIIGLSIFLPTKLSIDILVIIFLIILFLILKFIILVYGSIMEHRTKSKRQSQN
jgi:hypothetical protein